jgi:hypothetical protein
MNFTNPANVFVPLSFTLPRNWMMQVVHTLNALGAFMRRAASQVTLKTMFIPIENDATLPIFAGTRPTLKASGQRMTHM